MKPTPAKKLTVELNGKTYTAAKPKTKVYRSIIRIMSKYQDTDLAGLSFMDNEDAYEEMLEFAAMAFNHPDVTPEAIEEGLDSDQFPAFLESCMLWIQGIAENKNSQVPK